MPSGRGASPGWPRRPSRRGRRPDPAGAGAVGSSPSGSASTSTVSRASSEAEGLEPRLDRPGERLARLPPRRRRGRPRPLERRPRPRPGARRGPKVGLVALDRGELRLDLGAAGGQVVGGAAEPGGQPAVEGQPRLDLLEPGGVVVPALAEVAQAVGDLAGLVGQPSRSAAASASSGDRAGERLERAGDPLEHLLGRAVGLVEQGVALGGGRAELLGVGQAVRLAGQLVVLAGAGGRRRPARRARIRAGPARAGAFRRLRAASSRWRRSASCASPRCDSRHAAGRGRRRRRAGRAGGRGRAGPGPRAGRGCRSAVRPAAWSVATVTGRPLTCGGLRPGPRSAG